MKWVAGLAAGAVWLIACMPAIAQPTSKTFDELNEDELGELYCVYDELDFYVDHKVLVDGYRAGNPEAAGYKQQLGEVEASVAECLDMFEWDQGRQDSAAMIGFYGVMGDELERRLSAVGLTHAELEAFYVNIEKLGDGDITAFLDGSWKTNKDVLQRVKAAAGAKVAGNASMADDAAYLAESFIIVSMLTMDWLKGVPKS